MLQEDTLLPFYSMDGLGNDFVILDARGLSRFSLTPEQVCKIASRDNPNTGGCDQLIVMEDAPAGSAPHGCFMRIYNQDGGQVDACGNATRCVGWLLHRESDTKEAAIYTAASDAPLLAYPSADGVMVKMLPPRFGWQEIPLGWDCDTLNLPAEHSALKGGASVSMGNPHAVYFLNEDIETIRLSDIAPSIQRWQEGGESLFPEGVNVGIANIISESELKLRVFERGVGETKACGTGAVAAAVLARRTGRIKQDKITVKLRGGDLVIRWTDGRDSAPYMAGAVHYREQKKRSLKEMLA